jgi:hypothetical protein
MTPVPPPLSALPRGCGHRFPNPAPAPAPSACRRSAGLPTPRRYGRFDPRWAAPGVRVRDSPNVSFGDLVRMLAEGIADAQASLDRASAELVEELAHTTVSVVPRAKAIDADGNVTYEHDEAQTVSLLSLAVTPTFYQFSQASVEVALDIKIVEQLEASGEGRRFGLSPKPRIRARAKARSRRAGAFGVDGDARSGADAAAAGAEPHDHDAGAVARPSAPTWRIPRGRRSLPRRRPGIVGRRWPSDRIHGGDLGG